MSTLKLNKPPSGGSANKASPAPVAWEKTPKAGSMVFLIQEPTIPRNNARVIDISPLMWWGQVRVIMERGQTASYRPGAALLQAHTRLKDFQPDRDYIAVAGGDTLAILIAGSVLTTLGHDHFYYLRFERTRLPDGTRDPASGSYVPIYVPLTQAGASASPGP